MRCLSSLFFMLVLGLMGCSETAGTGGTAGDGGSGGTAGDAGAGGSAPIKSGLWLGGDPASNADGNAFDTGWAICFFVNEDGTVLIPSTECDIDGNDDEAYVLEVTWKNDVGAGTVQGEVGICNANPEEGSESIGIGDSYPFEDAFGIGAVGVPIEDSSFAIPLGFLFPDVEITGGEIIGTFDGDTASGTANWEWAPGMGYSQCELGGGWTAALVETDCTGEDWYTTCRGDGRVGYCFADLCVTAGCSGQEDGTYCNNPVLGDGFLGVCEAEECTMPEDCTGIADGVNCTGADFVGTCEAGECVSL